MYTAPLYLRPCFNSYFLIRCPFSLFHIASVQFIGYKPLGLLHNNSYSIVCDKLLIPLFWCIPYCFQLSDSNYLSKLLLVAWHCYCNGDALNNFKCFEIFNINFSPIVWVFLAMQCAQKNTNWMYLQALFFCCKNCFFLKALQIFHVLYVIY